MSGVGPVGPTSLGGPAAGSPEARLKTAAQEFEGLFLARLFREMRASVPNELLGSSPGEEMFTSMLDDAMAQEAARRSTHGLGDALYRQLARRLTPPASGEGQRG
ncbi:MAG: rod-binding protein [Gemmatimonadales bacterium]